MKMSEWRAQHPEATAEHSRRQRQKDPEKMRWFSRESYKRHRKTRLSARQLAYQQAKIDTPDKVKFGARRKWLLSQYDMTPEQYEKQYAEQQGKCSICKQEFARLCVDHDHKTGIRRELLCCMCNARVGWVEKDLAAVKAAIDYVERWNHGEDHE